MVQTSHNRHGGKRRFRVGLLALLVLGVGAVAGYYVVSTRQAVAPAADTSSKSASKTATPKSATPSDTKTVVRLAMLGDMLAHDSVNAQAKTASGYDYTPYFAHIKPLYQSADVVFCNPETPVAGDTLGVSGYPVFNAPSAFARDLVNGAGCNVINLASNHQSDKGQAGIDASRVIWQDLKPYALHGMNSSAAEQNSVSYFSVKGVRFAFVAFADYSNATPPNSYSLNMYHNVALVEQLMSEARQHAQVILVSAHWGTEDSNTVNSDQRAAAQLFADTGATVIIGTGPHVEQAVSWLRTNDGRDVPVWYSLGNMLSSQLEINQLTSGVAQCDIVFSNGTNGAPTVESLSFAPTFMSYDWPAADKAAGRLETRSNLALRPLKDAETAIQTMFGSGYSVAERRAYLEKTLDASNARVTVQ